MEQSDSAVRPSARRVTGGEAVHALGLNAWEFASRALYLTPEFFVNKPVDLVIRAGLQAEDRHEASLGRALDRLSQAGVTEVWARLASPVLQGAGFQHCFVPLDSTSISLQGQDAVEADDPRA
jgi:hypothetical protein